MPAQLSHQLQLAQGREETALQEVSALEEQFDAMTQQLERSRYIKLVCFLPKMIFFHECIHECLIV